MKHLFSLFLVLGITFVASSFTSSDAVKTQGLVLVEVGAPVYWEGQATCSPNYLNIKVYESPGQCNAYYAVITGGTAAKSEDIGNSYTVHSSSRYSNVNHYITYRNKDYYWYMR